MAQPSPETEPVFSAPPPPSARARVGVLHTSPFSCNVQDLSERASQSMEVSSRLQSLLRPLLLCRSRAAGRAFQTLALRSPPPPPPPRLPSSFLFRTRRLPAPHPYGAPSCLLFHRPFASVSPAPAPVPGRDHLNSKDQGPPLPPAPLPPPPPEELASEDESYYHEHLLEVAQENQSRVVPVKAFFLCTRYRLVER